jgi:hypothetical protein
MEGVATIEDYLEYVGRFRANAFGKRYRRQFRDSRGTAELAMLAAPSEEEYEEFQRLVDAMTTQEKRQIPTLKDEQIRDLAQRAGVSPANAAIFINGYVLAVKKTEK